MRYGFKMGSEDFVEGVWLMLNQKEPKEYILASGETHTVRSFVEKAFRVANIKVEWNGTGAETVGVENYLASDGEKSWYETNWLVRTNPKFYRPAEVDLLLGDSTPIREELGWQPKVSFDELVTRMVQNELRQVGL